LSARHTAGLEVTGTNSMRSDTTCKSDILDSDDSYAELTPGHRIEMNFSKPTKTGRVRDFIVIIEGHYRKAGSPYACTVVWQEWFDLLEDRTRNYGWIWANVAGYSFYYFGNTWYDSKIPEQYREKPSQDGLKQFLTQDVECYYYSEHWAERSYDFVERSGFDPLLAYHDLPDGVSCGRPFATMDLLWNTVGYTDKDVTEEPHVTASVTMNGTETGIFIHNGLAQDADGDGSPNTADDDYSKGYIATVLAIEEARAFLRHPRYVSDIAGRFIDGIEVGNEHVGAFSVSMVPGGWGKDSGWFDGVYRHFRYMDLRLTVSTHYEDYTFIQDGVWFTKSLSVADFMLFGDYSEVWGSVKLGDSGWEIGSQDRSYNDDLGWWALGATASVLKIPYLDITIGLIPLLSRDPDTPDVDSFNSSILGVYANGTAIDENDDEWGTITMYFRVIFLWSGSPGDYDFNLDMVSWTKLSWFSGEVTRRESISTIIPLEFAVTG